MLLWFGNPSRSWVGSGASGGLARVGRSVAAFVDVLAVGEADADDDVEDDGSSSDPPLQPPSTRAAQSARPTAARLPEREWNELRRCPAPVVMPEVN